MKPPKNPSLRASLVLCALLSASAVRAQEVRTVRVETNLPEAVVYVDGARLGPVGAGAVVVPAGARRLRLVAPTQDAWSIAPVEAHLVPGTSDTLVLRMPFPHYHRVETVPFGARVYLETARGRALLGETPLVHRSDGALAGALVVEADGFAPQRVVPGGDVWNRYSLLLAPARPPDEAGAEVAWEPPRRHRAWIDYAALGTALAAGAVAVHYKFKADRAYDRYLATTDPALRPEVKRHDVRSGVAFGVMQAGVGVFAIRLIRRR